MALARRARRVVSRLEDFVLEPARSREDEPERSQPLARPVEAVRPRAAPDVVLASAVGGAGGGVALAAAVGVAIAARAGGRRGAVLLVDLDPAPRSSGPTLLASAPARELEDALRALGGSYSAAAARGHICRLAVPGEDGLDRVAELLAARLPAALVIVHLPQRMWSQAVADRRLGARAGVLQADLPADRPLVALAVRELHERGMRAKVAGRPLGRVGARRALAGIEPGGAASARCARWARSFEALRLDSMRGQRGQALIAHARRSLRADPRRAGADRDRRSGDRHGPGPACGRPRRSVRRPLDARRL